MLSKETSRAEVVMPTVVRIRVGDLVKFVPVSRGGDNIAPFYKARTGQLARIVGFDARNENRIFVRFLADGYITSGSYKVSDFELQKPTMVRSLKGSLLRFNLAMR